MYYLLTGIIAVSILRYFNLIPKMTNKFWTYVDYALVLIAFVLWIGWHVISAKQENDKLEKLARKRHGANDWKSNVTDG